MVNKRRPLKPANFVPRDLVQPGVALAVSGEAALLNSTTAAAAEQMFAAAAADGVTMTLASGYRSYATQTATYNGYVSARGQADADTASARPGLFRAPDRLGVRHRRRRRGVQLPALLRRAAGRCVGQGQRVPVRLRGAVPVDAASDTGYYYESWHLRYVGVEAATDMRKRGIATLEEYFGLEAAPGYP